MAVGPSLVLGRSGEAHGPAGPGGVNLDSEATPVSPGCLVGWEKVGVGFLGWPQDKGHGEEGAPGMDNARTGDGPFLQWLVEQKQGGLQP